eukprot:2334742-Prymnesium_polylepis.4
MKRSPTLDSWLGKRQRGEAVLGTRVQAPEQAIQHTHVANTHNVYNGPVTFNITPETASPGNVRAEGAPPARETPSSQRSLEEVVATAYLADALHTLPSLRDHLLCGDATHRSDAVFDLGGQVIVYEHDPGFWHPTDRLEGDMNKTRLLLDGDERLVVVRARVKAPPLPLEDPRCVLVHVKSSKPGIVLAAVAPALAPYVPEPFSSRLRQAHSGVRKIAEMAAMDLYKEICPDYEKKVEERHTFLDENGLQAVDASQLVRMPLDTLRHTTTYLMNELGVNKEKIAAWPSLLSRSVEANLKPTAAYLMDELGMKKEKIATWPQVLCLSVEANLKPTAAYLMDEVGIKKEKIAAWPSLLGLSVDSNLKPTAAYLMNELGIKKEKIATYPSLLGKSVEANLKPTAAYLMNELGMKKEKIAVNPSLLWCSVEANLKPSAAYLMDELGIKKKKIATEPQLLFLRVEANLKPTVSYLMDELGIKKGKIAASPQLLCCSVDANLKPTAAYLMNEMGIKQKMIAMQPNLLCYNVEANLKPTTTYLLHELGINKEKIGTQPQLLALGVESNLKPTVAALTELGIDPSNVKTCPQILWKNVEFNLKPTFEWLRDKANVDVTILRNSLSILTASLQTIKCRFSLLREAGVPSSAIKMSHLRSIKLEKARLAWQTHGRHSMPTKEKLRIMMQA